MKKLNNKGFTLVELLAVVVILAVVMGIAMTSVITAMNNSRKGSLEDSAVSVERAFQTKYSEAMVSGTVSKIYADEMKATDNTVTGGYSFNDGSKDKPVVYLLNDALRDELNLSAKAYKLKGETTIDAVNKTTTDGTTTYSKTYTASYSFIVFNGNTVAACLIANKEGSYFVANAVGERNIANILGVTVTFDADDMWACSTSNVNSWTAADAVK